MNGTWQFVLAPGFFTNHEVVNALWVSTAIAIVSGLVGVFVIVRGQSFAGHALTDLGATGASGAVMLGANVWYGFLSFGLLSGAAMEGLGSRIRNRDVATGLVLSFAMGLGALFLYIDTQQANATVSMLVLFGSVFVINPALTPLVMAVGLAALVLLAILYRPLLLSSVSPTLAEARGVPVRWVSMLFMFVLAAAVEDGALVLGALLSTALLIGPAATAVRLTSRPGRALVWSAAVAVIATWAGIVCSYDSYYWPPYGRGWPVSFFIAAFVLLFYLAARFVPERSRAAERPSLQQEVKAP
ncbi:metal ABC transporter permease [Alicyclobacillus sp. ALC3]|uniref:metal ABC transporter permease n=1 Tax=Alicyclobacillus sp. ALC3 TaxID=2796143 RepID=UPI00237874AA|nr:metal ABC transporter permease [Alicyclobacillus sp. ALC3]WDL95863.1 metal ABC transporter permease [Alicyclobacillus sp. ALC3]